MRAQQTLPAVRAFWKLASLSTIGVALLLAACGGKSNSSGATGAGSSATGPAAVGSPVAAGSPAPAGTCGPAGSAIAGIPRTAQRKFDKAPDRIIDPTKTYVVHMSTAKGDITIELDAADAPNTVNNFVFLSCDGFYDGLIFHRVEKTPAPFVIQGGDPAGNGSGGPGYTFANEISPKLNHDTAGVISMARLPQPDTNGSQFFITLGPAPFLDGQYNAFGHVTDGMQVVNSIAVGDKILSVSIEEK